MKTEQLYKFVPIEKAKEKLESNNNYLTRSENGFETSRFWNGQRFEIAHYELDITHVLLPFHPSPKEISEEEMRKHVTNVLVKKDLNVFDKGSLLDENTQIYFKCRKACEEGIKLGLSLPSSGSKTEDCSVEFWFYVRENYDEKDLLFYLKEGKDKKGKSLPLVHQLFLKDKQQ